MSKLPEGVEETALEDMSDEAVEAMKSRNGWDTENGIPRKLKSLAYDLWGREKCSMCGASSSLHLHHCAPEIMDYVKRHDTWLNPYQDTEPWQLVPLCPSCHRKVENTNFSLMNRAMWWAALKKREEYDDKLETYLEERNIDIAEHRRTPLDKEYWEEVSGR